MAIEHCGRANCVSEFQDKQYGKGVRVHNPRYKGGITCTICCNVKGSSDKKKK